MDIKKLGGQGIGEFISQGQASNTKNSFGNILEKARQGVDAQAAAKASELMPPAPIHSVQPVADIQETAVQQADKLLSLLGEYSQGLENPGTTLKSIEPVVERMELEASAAKRVLSHLDSRGGLARVVNNAAVYASVEAIKFRRGDYV